MRKNKIKVLSLGYLPKQYGGRQPSGMASALFELSDAINRTSDDIEVILSCTDCFIEERKVRDTRVIGWNLKILLKHFLLHPFRSCYYCVMAVVLSLPYKQPILTNIGYFVFYDYCLEKIKPDFLHLDGAWRALLGNYILNTGRIKKIVRIHGIIGYDSNILDYKKWRKVEQRITRLPFHVITLVTNHLLKDWEIKYGKMKASSLAIPNGINFNIFYPTDTVDKEREVGKLRLLTVGSVSERKGQRRVIRAIAKFDDPSRFVYICIGGGDPKDVKKLIDEGKQYNIKVKYTNYIDIKELVNYMRQADYMILPSSSEGFGQVYIESIAVGTPVIIPGDLPICHEDGLINENNAILIEDSSEEAVYSGLCKALKMKFATSLVSQTVKHLSWDVVADKYSEIFREAI